MGVHLIIGITGKAQAGKSTVAERLVDRWGYTAFALADPLKSMALVLNPIVAYDGLAPVRLSELVAGEDWEEAKRHPEVRRLLQALGTEGVRSHLGSDSWVNALGKAIDEAGMPDAVIPDVRFPNEARFVKRNGGFILRVKRVNPDLSPFNNELGDNHPSEALVDLLPADHELVSVSGELIGLQDQVDAVAADIAEGFGSHQRPAGLEEDHAV